MKKYLLLTGIWLWVATQVHAQGQLGIKVAPHVTFNRVHTDLNSVHLSSGNSALKLQLGLIYDHPLKEDRYYVSTGLLYAVQQYAFQSSGQPKVDEVHGLEYLQVPCLLKLYTSEVVLDTRIYVEIGPVVQLRVNQGNTRLNSGSKPLVKAFHRWGAAAVLGAGAEYHVSLATSLSAGISYQRGWTNVVKEQQHQKVPSLFSANDLVSLNLGVKF